ncbi:MAG: hypothetical protein ACREIW_06090 [Chthoniobacterales bacterium]
MTLTSAELLFQLVRDFGELRQRGLEVFDDRGDYANSRKQQI